MYVIEHAFLNLGKNKGRNILLGVIISTIITATVMALAIYNTANAGIEETKTALQCAVRITPQRQTPAGGGIQVGGDGQGAESLTFDDYLFFAESEYLDGADIKPKTGSGSSGTEADAVYYLKQPGTLSAFETELRSKGLPDNYTVRTDESNLERMAGSIESLKSLAFTFLIIVLVLGAIIMTLLSAISIRERKYEIGVLRAMGMKKNKVALGLWAEIIAITCICFILGMGAGSLISQPVSDAIMAGQAQSSFMGSTSLADRLNEANGATDETVKIDVSVSAVTTLEIFAISILLASIAGIISVSRITKSEPIKILMERN